MHIAAPVRVPGSPSFDSPRGAPAPFETSSPYLSYSVAVPPTLPPGPDLPGLLELARAKPELAFPRGGHLSIAHNGHYTNTRAQLAYALRGDYNSLEGDVRLRDGEPVMAHDSGRVPELTFQQWAQVGAQSGRMLRIDLKESRALPMVEATLRSLGVPDDRISFNVGVDAPWTSANMSIEDIRALRERFPESWITLNVPAPIGLGYDRVVRAAGQIGGRVGMAILANLVNADLVARLTPHLVVNIWNYPLLWSPDDVDAERARLRGLGVNGMIDLRRRDDPLADD